MWHNQKLLHIARWLWPWHQEMQLRTEMEIRWRHCQLWTQGCHKRLDKCCIQWRPLHCILILDCGFDRETLFIVWNLFFFWHYVWREMTTWLCVVVMVTRKMCLWIIITSRKTIRNSSGCQYAMMASRVVSVCMTLASYFAIFPVRYWAKRVSSIAWTLVIIFMLAVVPQVTIFHLISKNRLLSLIQILI